MKKLSAVIEETSYSLFFNRDFYTEEAILNMNIEDLSYNSKKARGGVIFFCLVGAKADGHSFAHEAYRAGVKIFVCERVLSLGDDAVQIVVPNSRIALAEMSASFFGHPEKKLKIIGVTGTKGKSSVCEMIYHIFTSCGKKAALIGTIGIKTPKEFIPTENSTPESYILYKSLNKMYECGTEFVAMEVSSQAIYQDRIHGIFFDASIMTNLSEDHIGPYEHPNFEHYKNCKKELFRKTKYAFLNIDDTYFKEFSNYASCNILTYGINENADIVARDIMPFKAGNIFGISFECSAFGKNTSVTLPVPGMFSVYNALSAIAVCRYFGISIFDSSHALENVRIKGRFETVNTPLENITCVIDYAHNKDSLRRVLETIKEYSPSRLVCVFGSVGGRTKQRRKDMELVANALADYCIITSDNPDNESPGDIIDDIAQYISPEKYIKIEDRADAIKYAIETAKDGDFILFCGKGHEEYQLINGKKIYFSEKEIITKEAYARVGMTLK